MTRILLIVDANTHATYINEDPRSARELAVAINTGKLRIGEENLVFECERQWAIPISGFEMVVVVPQTPPALLTQRQYEVLFGLSDGLSAQEIADDLGISRRMVYDYTAALRKAFGKETQREMLASAYEAGLIEEMPV